MDHTRRLVPVGYGGTDEQIGGQERVLYHLIKGDLTVVNSETYLDKAQERPILEVAQRAMGQQHDRVPWGNDTQLRRFRPETESAMSEGPERFRLIQPEVSADRLVRRGVLASLFVGLGDA